MITDKDFEYTIRNVFVRLKHKYKRVPFWSFISEITGKGSTASREICSHFGWDIDTHVDKFKF
jgi:hypothetical protein